MNDNETNLNLTDGQNIYELYQDIIESPDYLAECKCGGGGWYSCNYNKCCRRMGSQTSIREC